MVVKKWERIFRFCATLNLAVGNTRFKKAASHIISYESRASNTQVKYCLVRRNQRKFLEDLKSYLVRSVWLPLGFKIRKVKDTRRKFVPRKNMWKNYTKTEQVVKKMLLLKVVIAFWKEPCQKLQTGVLDWQKALLDIKKQW